MFRKRQTVQAAEPAEDEIPVDLIASLPEIETGRPQEAAPAAEDWRPIPLPPSGAAVTVDKHPPTDVAGLVADMRRQMEQAFNRELDKIEDSFTTTLRQMEGQLNHANTELAELRREKEALQRMKIEYERKAEALRELARSFDHKS